MPYMQTMVERMNAMGSLESVRGLDPKGLGELWEGDPTFAEFARRAWGDDVGEAEQRYLDSWPEGLQRGVRAAVQSAMSRGQRVQVQWVPGYDFEVRMWEASERDGSPGGLIVQFTSPYPGDVQDATAY